MQPGPETSDAAFTWADFVTRNNSELVAGWGNLVNRTATMIAKSFGEIPPCGDLDPVDEAVLTTVRGGFDKVGDLVGHHRLRAGIAEAMRVVGEVNKYLTVTEPYKMKDEAQRERLATVLHVAAQCVSDCNTLLAPFLPHSANKVHAVLGGEGEFMPMPRSEQVAEPRARQRRGARELPGHHRRLLRHPRLGVAPGEGGCHGREADPGLRPSSTRPSSTRSWPGWAEPMSASTVPPEVLAEPRRPARTRAVRGRPSTRCRSIGSRTSMPAASLPGSTCPRAPVTRCSTSMAAASPWATW